MPDRSSCPHGEQLREILSKQDDLGDKLSAIDKKLAVLNERIPPNLPVRLSKVESGHKLLAFLGVTALGTSITAGVGYVWSKLTGVNP